MAGTLDFINNTCAVVLAPMFSSQQNLDVNQGSPDSIQLNYDTTTAIPQGWIDFKDEYPTHPLVTNTEVAEQPLTLDHYLYSDLLAK